MIAPGSGLLATRYHLRRQRFDKALKRWVCRWCGDPIEHPRRRSFCNDACRFEGELRMGVGVREKVWARDHGTCKRCGFAAGMWSDLLDELKAATLDALGKRPTRYRPRGGYAWWANPELVDLGRAAGVRCNGAAHGALFVDPCWIFTSYLGILEERGYNRTAVAQNGHLWEADHVVAVVEGGGACGMENLQTLCNPCHRIATAELAARRARKPRKRVGVL